MSNSDPKADREPPTESESESECEDDDSSDDFEEGELINVDENSSAEAEQSQRLLSGPVPVVVVRGRDPYQFEPLAQELEEEMEFDLPAQLPDVRGNRLDSNEWCQCGHCAVMPTFKPGDCLCCREIEEVSAEADLSSSTCITESPSFHPAILDPVSLYIGWQHFTEKWRRSARSFGSRNNEKYRYVAYRQFVRWCWGYLGKDIRVQLPACVQSVIKNSYPDEANHYRGTVLRKLNFT